MFYLGLDISTSCTGWSLIGPDGLLEDMGYIRLDTNKTLFQKALRVKECLLDINKAYKINNIYIEQNLQAFRSGFSSAKTIDKLAKFNGIISYISFDVFSIEPDFINVNSARRCLGIKIIRKKDGGDPVKNQILEWVSGEISQYKWPEKILKSGPRKGVAVLENGCFDMADAYVIARAGQVLNNTHL